jgi:hypothetical protein|tara:strand:+ start:105 stop:245 length:141 start_codon:yes stop_codon:yes gene_type:complete
MCSVNGVVIPKALFVLATFFGDNSAVIKTEGIFRKNGNGETLRLLN